MWRALSQRVRQVGDLWDAATSSFIPFSRFHAVAAGIRRQETRYHQLCTAVSAAWPDIAHAPAAESGPGVLISEVWIPAVDFPVARAALALLGPQQSVSDWWQRMYGGPRVEPALFRRLVRLPLPPAAKQVVLLYAQGALALHAHLPWLSAAEKVCCLCHVAVEDPLHFPTHCFGLHVVWAVCVAAGRLVPLPFSLPADASLIEFLARPAHQVTDGELVAASLYLHAAWRARASFREHQCLPSAAVVADWLCWDWQALLNGPATDLRRDVRAALMGLRLASMHGETCLLSFPEVVQRLLSLA